MGVYVDRIRDHGDSVKGAARRCGSLWCHMWADTEEELHEMATVLGMKRSWFQVSARGQRPHYDLVPRRRLVALGHGAVEMDYRAWLRLRRASQLG